jgi:hypothetical protein
VVFRRHRPRRSFGLYAITALLLLNGIQIALDPARSYVALIAWLGLARVSLSGIGGAEIDRAMRLLEAAIHVAAAVGIWTFRRWAWVALMIVVGISLGDGLLRYVRGQPEYVSMLLNVLTVFYLNQRDVQCLFRGDATAAPA